MATAQKPIQQRRNIHLKNIIFRAASGVTVIVLTVRKATFQHL